MLIVRQIQLKDVDQVFVHSYQMAVYTKSVSSFVLTRDKLIEGLFGDLSDWHGLVIEENDNILGSCLYCFTKINRIFNSTPCLFLDMLFIDSIHRKKGLGKMLVNSLIKIAKNNDIERIELWCMKDNVNSIEFYNSIGAKKVDLLDVYNISIIAGLT